MNALQMAKELVLILTSDDIWLNPYSINPIGAGGNNIGAIEQ